ncbi:HAD family hydrolase [Halosegnis marinus]|uniref:HAD family hydrolase n=1 Tax=Halosegnis marinus TaxID=3034023 RepID=A0ABD5ZK43_9EURY|nr:HAD family hydrolase [Halosegnis sp. DT85]
MPSGPDYDYWLLDLDGTVVDVEPGYVQDVFAAVGDRIGYGFTTEQAEILWHGLGGFRNNQLERWNIDPEAFWEAFHEVEDGEAHAAHSFVYPDAERFAAVDAPVGVVTHSQSYLAEPVLEALDIRDWFDTVLCCTDDTGWKPDPAPVRSVMADLGVRDDEHGVLAGDGPHDVGAAWNAGLDGVHVERHGHDRRGMCVLGDHRVRDFDELFA